MKIRYNSPVILTFTLISFGVFLLDHYLIHHLIESWFVASGTFQISNPAFYIGLITHIFGHASIGHLVSNFSLILILGPLLEEKYSPGVILRMIFITALLTGLLNALFFSSALLGASGIVFMLILLSSFANIRQGEIPITFILVAIIWLGREVVNAFEPDQVSQFAHVLGGSLGALFGYFPLGGARKAA